MQEAKAYLMDCFMKQGDYDFLPDGALNEMLEKLLALDEAFMARTGVDDGAVYDDEAAEEALLEGMQQEFPDFKMYMMRLVEDYLDYHEEYLLSVDGIEWE